MICHMVVMVKNGEVKKWRIHNTTGCMHDVQYISCMSYNWFGALCHQIAYKTSIRRCFVNVGNWWTFAYSWIEGSIVAVKYWYLAGCHWHVICDDLGKVMICLNIVKTVGVWTPWTEEEKAVGHLLIESLQWRIQCWIGSCCCSTFLVSCG
jgi:hypothetical protein